MSKINRIFAVDEKSDNYIFYNEEWNLKDDEE